MVTWYWSADSLIWQVSIDHNMMSYIGDTEDTTRWREDIEDITRWLEDMNFMFSWQEQYLVADGRKSARHAFILNNKLDARNLFNKSKRRESWRHWTIRHSQRWYTENTPLGSRMKWRMESTSGLVPSKTLSSIRNKWIYVRVARAISHESAKRTSEILFLPREHKIHLFLWMLLEKHPLCHRMRKVTKETSGANKIMRNAIDSTSITFRWTWSNSRQSVFSTTTIAKKTEENGSQSRKSDYLVKIGRWTSELLLG